MDTNGSGRGVPSSLRGVQTAIVGMSTAEDERGKRYSQFIVRVQVGGRRHVVFRTFRELQSLSDAVSAVAAVPAPFPRRTMEGRGPATAEFLEARRAALETWLSAALIVASGRSCEAAALNFLWDGADTPPPGYVGPSVASLLDGSDAVAADAAPRSAPTAAPAPPTAASAAAAPGRPAASKVARGPKLTDFQPIRGG
jgi:hypothetical protein